MKVKTVYKMTDVGASDVVSCGSVLVLLLMAVLCLALCALCMDGLLFLLLILVMDVTDDWNYCVRKPGTNNFQGSADDFGPTSAQY
eukprot:7013688-Ditylum_brightwellii.AAC.1